MTINDIRLTQYGREAKGSMGQVDDLTAQGKLDELYDAWKVIRDAAEQAMIRVDQIASGL